MSNPWKTWKCYGCGHVLGKCQKNKGSSSTKFAKPLEYYYEARKDGPSHIECEKCGNLVAFPGPEGL